MVVVLYSVLGKWSGSQGNPLGPADQVADYRNMVARAVSPDEEKLALLRGLTADRLASFDRGQGVLFEGDRQLADFIGKIGRRAAAWVGDSTPVND